MDEQPRLPIKIVVPRAEDIRRPEHGGGGSKVFGEVTPEVRDALDYQVGQVIRHFESAFSSSPDLPAVARVVLKPKALAKSHRPTKLLNDRTCPIIGAGRLGVLYVRAQVRGLRRLSQQIQQGTSKSRVASLSTIREITPYTAADALGSTGRELISQRIHGGHASFKLRLFRHHQPSMDTALESKFLDFAEELKLPQPEALNYSSGLRIFRLSGLREEMVDPLASFVGTQSLSTFPTYRIHRTASRAIGALDTQDFPPPVAGQSYPIVGIVDTGVDPTNVHLNPWIAGVEEYVPSHDRDYDHGTFVAGLAVHAQRMNQNPSFPGISSRVLNVVAMPASGSMTEDELLAILEDVIPKHPEVRVWNLSLSRDEPCADQGFSELAAALDRIQDENGVTFVVAAGNYNQPPLRGWPPDDLGDDDRIAPPGDSVRAVTVGAIAHLEKPSTRVRREDPSPFSRRGPGPAFIPKPEVVHYGGNCDASAGFAQTGVMSTNGPGQHAENIGTSFASPMVATVLANVDGALMEPASRNLTKALLVHSAVFGSEPVKAQELRYRGFGTPGDLTYILTCSPSSATLVFETELVPGVEFERWPFPVPDCLRGKNGVVKGEFLMTAVYEPPLDPAFGAEYCRANVDVSLGTYDPDESGKRKHNKKIPAEPTDVNLMYEKALVEHGFKWSPVKVFRRRMRGVSGTVWRLKVTVNHRSDFVSDTPQKFALVVTMRDPTEEQSVYDEVVARMQQYGWITNDLQIHERVRVRS